jgi:hypothetical protein
MVCPAGGTGRQQQRSYQGLALPHFAGNPWENTMADDLKGCTISVLAKTDRGDLPRPRMLIDAGASGRDDDVMLRSFSSTKSLT